MNRYKSMEGEHKGVDRVEGNEGGRAKIEREQEGFAKQEWGLEEIDDKNMLI